MEIERRKGGKGIPPLFVPFHVIFPFFGAVQRYFMIRRA
jgi:hypothetical protein